MSDPSTSPPEKAPAPAKPKTELLDMTIVKFALSIVAWLAPMPVSIVLLKLWYSDFAPADQQGTDPFTALRHTLTNFSGAAPDFVVLLSLLPSAVLLVILYRSAAKRVLALCVLLLAALAVMLSTMDIWSGQ